MSVPTGAALEAKQALQMGKYANRREKVKRIQCNHNNLLILLPPTATVAASNNSNWIIPDCYLITSKEGEAMLGNCHFLE